jgi:hypothetical protein
MVKNFFSLIIVIVVSAIAVFPLLHQGLHPTHDGEYHIVRFFLFNEALKDGILYPRWTWYLNNEFGLPLFNFVYPLPNYFASVLYFLGLSFINAFKASLFLSTLVGGVFFYLWAKEFWGRVGGVVASSFYTFSPYHILDIYIRGSIGEAWALAIFPGFLWSITMFIKKKKKIFLPISSIFLALTIFSHNILGLMFFVFSITYIALLIFYAKLNKSTAFSSLLIVVLGLGLSSIFWLPALYESKYAVGLKIFDVSSHFPQLFQLLIPSWGSGFSAGELGSQLSFQIGIANLLSIFLSIVFLIWFVIIKLNKKLILGFFVIWFFLTMYLMLSISLPFWENIPFMNYFQFPWRFLSISIICASFLAGCIFSVKTNKIANTFVAFLLVVLVIFLGLGYTKPAYYHDRDDNYYLERSNFINGTNSPGDTFNTIYMKKIPDKIDNKGEFLSGKGEININSATSAKYSLNVTAESDSVVLLNIAYFPGWQVYLDGRKTNFNITDEGKFSFSVPKGVYSAEVFFEDTFVRKISSLISISSFVFLIFLFIKNRSVTIRR